MTLHNTTECQQKLIELGYLPAVNPVTGKRSDDGVFGAISLGAYNRYRKVALHAVAVMPPIHLDALNADLFPEEQPPPAPKLTPNPIVQFIAGLALKAALNQLKGNPVFAFLDGYKTYIVGIACVIVGAIELVGWQLPFLPSSDPGAGWQLILTGLGFLGLRRAITTHSTTDAK